VVDRNDMDKGIEYNRAKVIEDKSIKGVIRSFMKSS
jgi:hypothetical protein